MNRRTIALAAALLLVCVGACAPAEEAAPGSESTAGSTAIASESTATETTETAATGSSWGSAVTGAQTRARAVAKDASRRAEEADAAQADQ